jgi:hypothetical protein
MTPFSTIIPVSKYLSLNLTPKSGSTIFKSDYGKYNAYCVITSYDDEKKKWYGKGRTGKIEEVNIMDKHIEIRVVPFEQHMALLRRRQ